MVELEDVAFEVLDEFPVPFADDAAGGSTENFGRGAAEVFLTLKVGGEVPEKGAFGEGFSVEGGEDTGAIEGLLDLTAGDFEEGGEKVDLGDHGIVFDSFGSATGEADEEGFTDTAFVEHSFGAAEWVGSGDAAEGSVVGGEDDEGVFGEFEFVEGVEDLSDGTVHGFDHGGVFGVVVTSVAFLALVFLSEFFGGLDGGVDGVEGEVNEEGGGGVFLNPACDFAAEALGEVFAFRAVFEVGVFVGGEVGFGMSPGGAAEIGVEAILGGVFREVPFSGDAGAVALFFESFGDGDEFGVEDGFVGDRDELAVLGISAVGVANGDDTVARGVGSGHEAGA